jgi:hypothetical protein
MEHLALLALQATDPVASTPFLQWAATLGVGGVLALAMFYVYRKDMSRYVDLWKGQSDALLLVVKENVTAVTAMAVLMEVIRNELRDAQARRGEIERRDPNGPLPTPDHPAPPGQTPIVDKIIKGR